MNTKMIRYILAKMLGVEAILLLLPALVSLIYGEFSGVYFLIPSGILIVIYLLVGMKKPEKRTIYGKEGMVIVASAWILWSLFGALPFTISGSIPSYLDAFFETVSGFTTTGSSILTDVEALPQGMLFWSSFTHWIGGMGVLVFVMVLTTLDKKNSMYLMRAEVPGPEKDKLVPRTMSTARILYGMYLCLTLIEVILLLLGGMNMFDSLIHAFGTAGTGGFGIKNDSFGSFSPYIQWVVTVFMILFGVNFNFYYFVLFRNIRKALSMEEVRTYFLIILTSVAILFVSLMNTMSNMWDALRHAAFQVASIITTTGYASADFDQWSQTCKTVLVILMFVGACAGSTGGGMKVSRLVIMFKTVVKELSSYFHPKNIKKINMDGKPVEHEVVRAVNVYFITLMGIFTLSVFLVSLEGRDLVTNFTAVA